MYCIEKLAFMCATLQRIDCVVVGKRRPFLKTTRGGLKVEVSEDAKGRHATAGEVNAIRTTGYVYRNQQTFCNGHDQKRTQTKFWQQCEHSQRIPASLPCVELDAARMATALTKARGEGSCSA